MAQHYTIVCTCTGPKFGQKIMDIIQIHKVALTADVEKAFLMISVSPKTEMFLDSYG